MARRQGEKGRAEDHIGAACTEMEAFKSGNVGWRGSPACVSPSPPRLDSDQEQVPTGEEGEGDAAESCQAVIPAPTRWCGKTGLCEKCAQYSHSPPRSTAGPCPAEAAAVGPQRLQHPRDPPRPGMPRGIWALVPLCSNEAGWSTEPAASIKSLLPNPAPVHALF